MSIVRMATSIVHNENNNENSLHKMLLWRSDCRGSSTFANGVGLTSVLGRREVCF